MATDVYILVSVVVRPCFFPKIFFMAHLRYIDTVTATRQSRSVEDKHTHANICMNGVRHKLLTNNIIANGTNHGLK